MSSAAELCEQMVISLSRHDSDFNMEQSVSLLKKLSNECSHASFADEVMTHNVIPVIIDTLLQHQKIRMLDPSYCFPLFFDKLLTSASFLISNFCSCGEKYILNYWEVNQDKLLDLLVLMSSRSCFKGIAAFLAALVTSLRPELPSHSQRLETLLANRPLCCQLLLISINRRLSSPSSPISNDSDSAIDEWMHLFALRILQNDRGKELFDLVGGKGEPSTFAALTHEQLILLRLFSTVFEDSGCGPHLLSSPSADLTSLACSLYSHLLCIPLELNMASAAIAFDDDEPAASGSWIASLCTSIQVLGSILAFYTLSAELRTLLLLPNMRSSCVVSTCDAILRSFKYPAKSPLLVRGSLLEALTDSLDQDTRNELIKDILCLLSNLCYQHPDAQDRMLSSGCLATVLGYCATDFSNPLAREWALLTVRNACENNETNQRFIESLQPQGVVQDESLRSRGISVEIDPLSGKFSFKQQQQTNEES